MYVYVVRDEIDQPEKGPTGPPVPYPTLADAYEAAYIEFASVDGNYCLVIERFDTAQCLIRYNPDSDELVFDGRVHINFHEASPTSSWAWFYELGKQFGRIIK